MNESRIAELGNAIYRPGIEPAAPRSADDRRTLVVGFDVEFTARNMGPEAHNNELVSVQFYSRGRVGFFPHWAFNVGPSGVSMTDFKRVLSRWLVGAGLLPEKRNKKLPYHVLLVSFFSVAELSILDLHDTRETFQLRPSGTSGFVLKDDAEGYDLSIVDVSGFFPHQSLSKVADSFGLKKLSHDRANVTRDDLKSPDFWGYAIRDAQLAYDIAVKLRGLGLATFGIDWINHQTPATFSAAYYRGAFLREPVTPTPKTIRQWALRCYWGGMNQTNYRGRVTGDIRVYDAVSMYPSACIALGKLPRGHDFRKLVQSEFDTALGGFGRFRFEFPEGEMFPCLPVVSAGSMYYPMKGVSDCTLAEARYARSIGAKVEVLSGYCYHDGDSSLSEYFRHLMALKDDAERSGDAPKRALIKVVMNSLVGKFGQNLKEWDLNDLRACANFLGMTLPQMFNIPEKDWAYLFEEAGMHVEKRIELGSVWQPEWAALIVGYARRVEAEAMRFTSAFSGTTDSVVCEGWPTLGDSFDIGGIHYRLQETGDSANFVRTRVYVITRNGEIVKDALHGFPKVREAAEAVRDWTGAIESQRIYVTRIQKVREGLYRGFGIGMHATTGYDVSFKWDGKRALGALGDTGWTRPHPEINPEAPKAARKSG